MTPKRKSILNDGQAVSEHLQILQLAIERQSKSAIAEQSQSLLDLLLKVFDLRRVQCSPRTAESYENEEMDAVEKIINKVAIKMIYKLNDATFRPLFIRISEWATTPTGKKEEQGKVYRQISWYTFLHGFFDTLQVWALFLLLHRRAELTCLSSQS